MTIVGTAEILVHANTTPFVAEVEGKSRAALAEVEREAEIAGNRTGTAMAAGVRKGTTAMAAESRAAGTTVGASLSQPIEHGAGRSSTAMVAAGAAGKKAFLGASLAIVGAAGEGIHLAESMQTTDAAIAGAAGTSVAAAKRVGDALLGTAGKSEFSGQVQAKAYAAVAGQLKVVEGRALSAAQATDFMRAAGDLAIAKQVDLGVAVNATASVIQGFGLKTKDAAHVTDVLFQASNASGVSIDAMATQLARLHSKLGDTAGSLTDVAGLLVDMTERGITGRAAMAAVNSGLNTIQRTAGGVTNSVKAQNDAFQAMPPALQRLVHAYQQGDISASQLSKATKTLTPEQQMLVKTFNSATGAVDKAQNKYKSLGVNVFDAHGKFVGMSSIIAQLEPKFAKMTQQQQLAAATTIFGAGAARQMTAVINAGTGAFEKATSTVGKHNAAQSAAEKQSKTLHRELQTLGATVSDLATEFGQVLVPAATSVIHTVASVTHFFIENHGAAVALAAVIGGALSVAVGVFAVNKMGGMVRSVKAAGAELRLFAGTASSVASTVASKFGLQATAAQESATKIAASQTAERASVRTTATAVGADNAAAGRSFTMVGTQAGLGAVEVEGKVAAEAGAVAAADTAIEVTNAAAGASFLALLGPIGAVAAAVVAVQEALHPGGDIHNFLDGVRAKIKAAQTKQDLSHVDPRLSGFPDGGATTAPGRTHSPTVRVPTSTSSTATSGLSASQRKQLANLMAAANGGGSGSSGSSSTHSKIPTSGTLTKSQLEALWVEAGGSVKTENMAASIALAESRGKVKATGHNRDGSTDRGLWQINSIHGRQSTYDALANARAAVAISQGGKNWSPWSTYQQGLEVPFLKLPGYASSSTKIKVPLYANPFAHAKGLHTGQTDMGVDYSMTPGSKIGAIGAGKVLGVTGGFQDPGGGNPNNGTYIAYKLTEGPNKGKVVYVAEQINSKVHAGQTLKVGQTIGTYASHGSGIEMGFANPHNWRQTLAAAHGHGAYAVRHAPDGTIEGRQFSAMLHSIDKGVSQTFSGSGGFTQKLTPKEKQFLSTEKLVAGQEAAYNKWLAGQRAIESIMTAAQKKALNEEIAVKRSALGIQTTREYSALTTQTKQQAAHLKQAGTDQKLASAIMTKLVAAQHSGSLKTLNTALKQVHDAGFGKLIQRLSHDHIDGFDQLRKQLVGVHKTALAKQAKEQEDATNKAVAAFLTAMDQAAAGIIGAQAQLDTDTTNAQVQAIQDQTKVTLDQQAEIGKTGADLVAAHAQTTLDTITQSNNTLIGAAQIAVDKAAGGTETEKATAAANLAAAQNAAAMQEAQAQATLDIDNAAAAAAAAAEQAAGSAAAATDVADAAVSSITDARQFNFEINGGGMTAAELFSEVGWALKTGSLPAAV